MDDCVVLQDFTLQIPLEDLLKRLHIEEEEDIALMQQLREEACKVARPKALYRVCSVEEAQGERVVLNGMEFESALLRKKLDGLHHVIAYVVTCGAEVDAWSRQETDMVVSLWLDSLKEMILHEARQQFVGRLAKRLQQEKLVSMNPGSGNLDTWPIAQQKRLFALLGDVKGKIGVELTESCLMLPTKSVSGVLFPSAEDFITCSLCKRENCIGRHAPYVPMEA
jgi:hypothetical protein